MDYYVSKIKWDRIWISFYIKADCPYDGNVYLINSDGNIRFNLKCYSDNPEKNTKLSNAHIKEFRLNITNPGNCKMLPTGIYNLYFETKDKGHTSHTLIQPAIDLNPVKYNREFVYFHSERAYRVQFSAKNSFKIKASDVKLKNLSLSRRLASGLRSFRHNTAKMILRGIYNIEYIILHKNNFSKNSPYILLMSDQSEEMGSNMTALKEALHKKGYKTHEALRAVTTKHYSILHWIKTLSKIASANYIFLDDHSQTTDWLTIKGAVITQLWHAGAGFKSTGYSRFGMPASPAPRSGHRQYTYGIAGSKKIRHFFSEVWGINDEQVLPTGMPRLDKYLNTDYMEKTKTALYDSYPELCKPKRNIILFAPTYRGENKRKAYYPYDMLDFDKLYKMCQKTDSYIIFKMHPFVSEPVPIPKEYSDRMLDLTSYPDINDLFYITDILITDYSSNIYEFSLMKKPMLFYAFDIDEYTKERGFHRDYRANVPGKIAETFDELIDSIETENFEYEKVEEYVRNNFDHTDNHACDRIIDWIIRGKLPKNI
ncbi:MAG: CDP-glycerol glycerophosphotransferase family protein [Eubacterium sp.]|nr:CDP-glycerol glycerophosphotransferase family protein [Eubacterium sp.]